MERQNRQIIKAVYAAALIVPLGIIAANRLRGNRGLACELVASQPTDSGGVIQSYGGAECPDSALVRVRLRRHRPWWWDETLTKKSQEGSNVRIDLAYRCKYSRNWVVFTETRRKGRKQQSRRAAVHCRGTG
jgi:hypothetical protein